MWELSSSAHGLPLGRQSSSTSGVASPRPRRPRTPFSAPAPRCPGLPTSFRFHEGRHYFASLLVASGADVKVVRARLRHASAMTTLDTYAHLWPDSDDSTRAAVDTVLAARADYLRTAGGEAR